MFELGGVPSEERFQKLTEAQWAVLISHHINRKNNTMEEIVKGLEYMALLVTINPKGVMKAINARRKAMEMAENQKADPEKYFTVNAQGENEHGQVVNTTFYADIAKYAGEDILAKFEDAVDYKIKPNENVQDTNDILDEDDKFIAEAKRAFAERESELEEEARFREENPELFNTDSVSF